jgi:hypothetical protein
MADEKRQLILDLLARNKMRKDTEDAASDLDKLGKAAEDADKKTTHLGDSSEKTGGQVDKLGHNLDNTKSRIGGLDKEIDGIQKELAALSASFADAGSASERLDISKAIRRTETDLKKITKNRDVLKGLLPDPGPEIKKWGTKFSQGLNDSIAGDFASSSIFAPAIAVLGVTLAPMIGGLISAAVLGGVGTGGIIGGIALAASSDQQIKTWAGNIGHSFKDGVTAEAKDAFSGPIMDSLGKVEALANRSIGKIGDIFDRLAPSTFKLTDNLVRAGDAILDSLVNAAGKAGPVMDVLGNIVEDTAVNLGKFIDMAADHSDEAASALADLNDALQNTITVATAVVGALADIKGGLDSFDDGIDKARYGLEDHVSWLDLTADGYKKGSVAAQMYRDGLIGAAGSADDYDHYLQGAVNSTDSMKTAQDAAAEATKKHQEAVQALTNELKAQTDPAFALLDATDKVRDAQQAQADAIAKSGSKSEEARAATRKLAEAAIELSTAAGNAGGTIDGHLSPAMYATLRAAGLTKSQIAGVEAELKRATKAAQNYEGNYNANITTTYYSKYVGKYYPTANEAERDMGRRASGGPVVRGVPYLVGENGPEVIVPETGGRVINASGTRGMMVDAAAGGLTRGTGGGGGSWDGTLKVSGTADSKVASLINYLIRTGQVTA